MPAIERNPGGAAREDYDLIIIGGGIYGVMTLYEATRTGARALLVEKQDFGGLTSFNNLRIVHGGLRYLQTLHISRIIESVAERRWFLRTWPEFVEPLACLMPLYGGLTKNRPVLTAALIINDLISWHRNRGLRDDRILPNGKTLSAADTTRHFPLVRQDGLRSGALWYDAAVRDCQRVLIETLRWSVAGGATALNYVEAMSLCASNGQTAGIIATDLETGETHEYRSKLVLNAAGPSCRAISKAFDTDHPELFAPSLAWNLLLDRPALGDCAVAVEPPRKDSRVYFAHSLKGRIFVGTGHAALEPGQDPVPTREQLGAMLDDLNLAIPGLDATRSDIVQVFAGQLPAKTPGTDELSDRPTILDHGSQNGPTGLVSVSGVKYTTARSTAARVVEFVSKRGLLQPQDSAGGLPERPTPVPYALHPDDCPDRAARVVRARDLIRDEGPRRLADLLLRRSNLAGDPEAALAVADDAAEAFGWSADRKASEISTLRRELQF